MHIIGAIRLTFASALRVMHIALWMTIPTVFWLWLVLAETPVECVLKYGWYQGNVLCVSEDTHILIILCTFLMGALVISLWTEGFIFEAIGRIARGDWKLPPVRLSAIGTGCGLLCSSLRYWLPFIAAVLAAHAFRASVYPRDFGRPVLDAFPLLLALVPTLLLAWGFVVGLARGAVHGDRSLICRRRENVRLALASIRPTLAVTPLLAALLFLPTRLGSVAMPALDTLAYPLAEIDAFLGAALYAFAFYCALICWSIACSHVIARYARKIGIGKMLEPSAKPGKRQSNGL